MGKIFGLSIFVNFFVIGILLGRSRHPITAKTAGLVLLYLLVVFIVMGLIVSTQPAFLIPK